MISSRPLVELVPVMPCAMAGRQMCQWDKDSCADAGFLKIDLLGLGMLSAVEDCVDQIAQLRGETIDLSRIPLDDPDVFAEIQRADTVGDFQIESRAQMQMLLRTRPENARRPHDPGRARAARADPGQGASTRTSSGARSCARTRPSSRRSTIRCSRSRCAPRSASSSSRTRCSTWRWRSPGFTRGGGRGAAPGDEPQAQRGGARGLPRPLRRGRGRERASTPSSRTRSTTSSSASRASASRSRTRPRSALLAYQSAWLRHHYPAEFLCALLNAQPMGFYPPASLVRDAQRRGVEVLPPDVNLSAAKCAVEDGVVRIGLEYVDSVGEDDAEALVEERGRERAVRERRRARPAGAAQQRRARGARRLGRLRRARRPRGARCSGSSGSFRGRSRCPGAAARSTSSRCRSTRRPRRRSCPSRRPGSGCSPTTGARASRSASTRSSSCGRTCPTGVLSSERAARGAEPLAVAVAGMAVARQRPATANGVVFMLLEDEHGQMNLIVPPQVYDRFRAVVRGEPLVLARGRFEQVGREPQRARPRARDARPARAPRSSEGDVHGSLCRPPTTSATAR